MKKDINQPYEAFGRLLKTHREKSSKNQLEVSGAVEIDQKKLVDYESGIRRPTQDILILLIQHFSLPPDEANELWRLAGYVGLPDDMQYFDSDDNAGLPSPRVQKVIVSPHDARIVYTDMVQVMVNNYGVIVNFMQGAGVDNSPLAVSRVGMSKEHARSLIDILKSTLEQSEVVGKKESDSNNSPKQLSSGQNNKD